MDNKGGEAAAAPKRTRKSSATPQSTAFLLAQVGAHGADRFAQRLAPLRLLPAQAGALRMIAKGADLNQRQLAERLQAVPSRVVSLLDDLEQRGLVTRARRSEDRRSHALALTPSGEAVLTQLRGISRDHDAALLSVLSETEKQSLHDILSRLAEAHGLPDGAHPGFGRRRASPHETDCA